MGLVFFGALPKIKSIKDDDIKQKNLIEPRQEGPLEQADEDDKIGQTVDGKEEVGGCQRQVAAPTEIVIDEKEHNKAKGR